jgi:zinc protease
VLVVVGDVTLDEARRLAVKHFGSWSGPAVDLGPLPEPRPAKTGRVYLVDRQDSAQSVVTLILPGAPRSSPDYHGLQIVDAVFGGTFGSRINMNLRESKGYSYGVFSAPVFLKAAGWWQAGGGVQTKVTRESIAELVKELKAVEGTKPIDAKELATAKANRVRGYSQGFEGLDHIAGRVDALWVLDRPLAELATEPVELEKVTLEQANRIAKGYADPARTIWLVVGDRSKIELGLKELGLGEIVAVDPLGRTLETVSGR